MTNTFDCYLRSRQTVVEKYTVINIPLSSILIGYTHNKRTKVTYKLYTDNNNLYSEVLHKGNIRATRVEYYEYK